MLFIMHTLKSTVPWKSGARLRAQSHVSISWEMELHHNIRAVSVEQTLLWWKQKACNFAQIQTNISPSDLKFKWSMIYIQWSAVTVYGRAVRIWEAQNNCIVLTVLIFCQKIFCQKKISIIPGARIAGMRYTFFLNFFRFRFI